VVTAGGTREPVDDVRVLTNLSTGRFGAALANALVTRGVRVTLLASRPLARRSDWLDPRVEVVPFGSFADLDTGLAAVLARGAPELLFMAAAVSDYRPERATGKLSSADATRSLHLVRNPKLLASLRERCGPATTLVGFKLLSGVTAEELVAVARRQVDHNDLDLCFANDLSELSTGLHPAWIVPPTGEPLRLTGDKATSAAQLVERALAVRDLRPEADALDTERLIAGVPGWEEAHELRGWGTPNLLAPRGVGDREQALLDALAAAALRGEWEGGPISVGTPGERQWLLGPAGTVADFEVALRRAQFGLAAHIETRSLTRPQAVVPVLQGTTLVGLTAEHSGGSGLWISGDARRRGHGDRVAHTLDQAGVSVVVHESLGVLPWWVERGWHPTGTGDSGTLLLRPPSQRDDVHPAASLCLVSPLDGRVLLGKRLVEPWRGYLAFPGGSVDAGESPLEAGRRELVEETGIRLSDTARPLQERVVHVSSGDGARCYRVHNFVFAVLDAPAPRPTPELHPQWVALADAQHLRPMAAGTRRVLRELAEGPPWPVPVPRLAG
jgi:8-oxo-dGTP pyrophosphatase MutT (NUDIX family)